jgi:hypothetical protein
MTEIGGNGHPRLLSVVPFDIAEILKEIEREEADKKKN